MQNVNNMHCPDYPPLSYTLVVEDAGGVAGQTVPASGSVISITVGNLMEDTHYLYYVVATNQIGNSSKSASVEICEQCKCP